VSSSNNTHNTGGRAVNWRSRSFKVINFCCSRKPIYDFLVVISCHLSSHCSWDIASQSRKPPHPSHSTRSMGPASNFVVKLITLKIKTYATFMWKPVILASVILLQYTRITDDDDRRQPEDRQTTYHNNSRTLQCNCNVRLIIAVKKSRWYESYM